MHRIDDRGKVIVRVEILSSCPPKTLISQGSNIFLTGNKVHGIGGWSEGDIGLSESIPLTSNCTTLPVMVQQLDTIDVYRGLNIPVSKVTRLQAIVINKS